MKVKLIYFVFLLVLLKFVSCASTSSITKVKLYYGNNLSPAFLKCKPTVLVYKEPEADFTSYRTFSVFPLSIIAKDVKMNPILERQILFFIRNIFEAKGYKFVPIDSTPDFLITAQVDIEYKEIKVPPSIKQVPVWVPGKYITIHDFSYYRFNMSSYNSNFSHTWGTWQGMDTKTIYVPGYLTTKTYIKPGYTVGYFLPSAIIWVYDGKTLKNVWSGCGVGVSKNPDIRACSQFVIRDILKNFPICSNIDSSAFKCETGVRIAIFTVDGNSYYPTVLEVIKGTPADSIGIKKYDMIIEIDSVNTCNKPFSEIIKLLEGKPGTKTRIKVKRLNSIITFDLLRIPYKK